MCVGCDVKVVWMMWWWVLCGVWCVCGECGCVLRDVCECEGDGDGDGGVCEWGEGGVDVIGWLDGGGEGEWEVRRGDASDALIVISRDARTRWEMNGMGVMDDVGGWLRDEINCGDVWISVIGG